MSYPRDPHQDQVPRLRAFQAAHPDITIVSPAESGTLRWTARRAGDVLCSELDLAHFLDRLERLLEQGELGPGSRPLSGIGHPGLSRVRVTCMDAGAVSGCRTPGGR